MRTAVKKVVVSRVAEAYGLVVAPNPKEKLENKKLVRELLTNSCFHCEVYIRI